jgi:hypothetical protein
VTYVVNVEPGDIARFKDAGFSPIKELRVRLSWSRVSDINGWGTGVNGEVHRRVSKELVFSGKELGDSFQLLRDFERDPLSVLGRYPDDAGYIYRSVSAFERGYVVSSGIQLIIGNKWTKDERLLFADNSESGYYR